MSRSDEKVKAAYRALEQSRDRLKAAERLLQDAIDMGPVGAAPPARTVEEVGSLQRQTEDLLEARCWRSPRAPRSGARPDSTTAATNNPSGKASRACDAIASVAIGHCAASVTSSGASSRIRSS